MDEPQRHDAEGKRTISKGYITFDFMYVTFRKRQNYREHRFPGVGVGRVCNHKGTT